jgi:hypothetical protein
MFKLYCIYFKPATFYTCNACPKKGEIVIYIIGYDIVKNGVILIDVIIAHRKKN